MPLRPPAHRPFVLIQTLDQWRRCSHLQTNLDVLAGTVELERQTEPTPPLVDVPLTLAGLAFDRGCRLFRALPEHGQVHMHRWQQAEQIPADAAGRPVFATRDASPVGEFVSEQDDLGPLARPTGLAVDVGNRLIVWEAARGDLLTFDLENPRGGRLCERVSFGETGPLDLAWIRDRLVGVGPDVPGMLERGSDGHLRLRPLGSLDGLPCRVTGDSRGRTWVLLDAHKADARIVALCDGFGTIAVPGASDLVFRSPRDDAEGGAELLVVARGPNQTFATFVIGPANSGLVTRSDSLSANGYDGRGIARTPDDRIVYFGGRGLRHAVAAPRRYPKTGTVIGYRLDAGEFQARWGRVFIDACVPRGTELRIATVVTDEDDDDVTGPVIERKPPANERPAPGEPPAKLPFAERTPMPPQTLVPSEITGRLAQRTSDRELPWTIRDESERRRFKTWESVVVAPESNSETTSLGRYLWVFIELRGNGRRTPSIRSLRVERVGHPLLTQLPKVFSREPLAAEFLWRFLALFDGGLVDLELRTALRHAMLHPRSSPEPFLPWLAELVGLALDERWSVGARRRVIAEATALFRSRGTVPGLRRLLEIYLTDGAEGEQGVVQIIEHFRVRGLGGAITSDAGPTDSNAVLGAGFRVGGALGVADIVDVASQQSQNALGATAFLAHAHRFTVIVLRPLTAEQREVLEHILDQHRPAHTLYDLCTAETGLRVGVGLHLGLSTVVGASAGWNELQLGASTLGGIGILGQPRPGTSLGGSRLGEDSEVG
jgi:phage tail-like protein